MSAMLFPSPAISSLPSHSPLAISSLRASNRFFSLFFAFLSILLYVSFMITLARNSSRVSGTMGFTGSWIVNSFLVKDTSSGSFRLNSG